MASDKFAELWVVDPKRPKRRSWLVDSNRIAIKIKIASGQNDPHQVVWNSNPTRHCPNCHTSLTTEVMTGQALPGGVKFDPSDPEIICHLLAKSVLLGFISHPFIIEFIPTALSTMELCPTFPKSYKILGMCAGIKQEELNRSFWMVRLVTVMSVGCSEAELSKKLLLPAFGLASSNSKYLCETKTEIKLQINGLSVCKSISRTTGSSPATAYQ
ncbi:hypothetical protein F2Q69_00004926 [Brassica cretica]|uniref:NAC domain-containing protein n=1 Tax=Brassica cretica TaxID=69181 RepID=A0A8S9PLR6_BRACR|nr:hypothetical protein F2Q69_00004926 [Brassica cretica]